MLFGNSKHSRWLASLWWEIQKNQGKRGCQTSVTVLCSIVLGRHPFTFVVSLCQEAGQRLCPHSVVDYTRVLMSGQRDHGMFSKFTSHTHCQLSRTYLKQSNSAQIHAQPIHLCAMDKESIFSRKNNICDKPHMGNHSTGCT